MRKFLAAAVSFAAITVAAAPASAADMAVKAPPPAPLPVIYNWTGFYIGANGGWGQSRNCWDLVNCGRTFDEGCSARSGGLVGGQIGYRWQANQWVFGVEAQGDWADLSHSRVSLFYPEALASHQNRWHRPLYRPDRLRLERSAALHKGRRGGDKQPL